MIEVNKTINNKRSRRRQETTGTQVKPDLNRREVMPLS